MSDAKKHKTFDDETTNNSKMPMAKESCLAEDTFVSPARLSMKNDLDRFKHELKSGWDGEDSLPIDEKVYLNCNEIIDNCESYILNNWILQPNYNGSLYFVGKNTDAMLNLCDNCFSYYYTKNGFTISSDYENYSLNSFVSVLRNVAK
ncbi:MAG: hypothetical protein MJZ66_09185 [Bacteroidales bacterium]|nr:hypothetical protein [Bacteroidales bacterium]